MTKTIEDKATITKTRVGDKEVRKVSIDTENVTSKEDLRKVLQAAGIPDASIEGTLDQAWEACQRVQNGESPEDNTRLYGLDEETGKVDEIKTGKEAHDLMKSLAAFDLVNDLSGADDHTFSALIHDAAKDVEQEIAPGVEWSEQDAAILVQRAQFGSLSYDNLMHTAEMLVLDSETKLVPEYLYKPTDLETCLSLVKKHVAGGIDEMDDMPMPKSIELRCREWADRDPSYFTGPEKGYGHTGGEFIPIVMIADCICIDVSEHMQDRAKAQNMIRLLAMARKAIRVLGGNPDTDLEVQRIDEAVIANDATGDMTEDEAQKAALADMDPSNLPRA